MKAIPFLKRCDAEDLKIEDWPNPVIEADEVLIEVKAFGVNYADIMARKGLYSDAPSFPFVAGYEVAGVIVDKGKDVKKFKKGDKVLAVTNFGGYAEYAKTKALGCSLIPKQMSFAQGASIPVNFTTAHHSLYHTGLLQKNDRVLIHAAAGGVGLAAVQMAKNEGCEIFGTASSERKLELMREYGVNHTINYRTEDFVKEIKKITNNEGLDVILDSIGGSYVKKGLGILRPTGRIVAYGIAALSNRGGINSLGLIRQVVSMLTLSAIDLLSFSKAFHGVNMKALGDARPELLKKCLDDVLKQFEKKKLKTVIHEELPWAEIGKAHSMLENRQSTGKIVCLIN